MKKATFIVAAALAFAGSISLADILLPGTAVVNGDDAKSIVKQIKEITGSEGTEFRGQKVFSAKADVQCIEYKVGDIACKVIIQK